MTVGGELTTCPGRHNIARLFINLACVRETERLWVNEGDVCGVKSYSYRDIYRSELDKCN